MNVPRFPAVRTILVLAVISLLLPGCASRSAWETSVAWKDLDPRSLPGPDQYPDANAVVLLDEGTVEMIGSGETGISLFEHHRMIKVLKPSGQDYANVVIPYSGETTVEDIEARTIAPDGKISVVRDEDIFDTSLYPNFIFFSDQRAKLFTLPAVEEGAVLEYRYTLRLRGHTFWHSWNFQDRIPTRLSRFTLVSPSEYPVKPRLYGITLEPKVVKAPQGFKSTMIWEARDVPALESEFGMPPSHEICAHLAIAPLGFRSWDDVAGWYSTLAKPREAGGAHVKDVAARIVADAADDRTKLRRIYEWIQRRVRYMAVEVGVGGFQPHAAEEVCSKRYGDCKDMATLLCAIAREAGIEVNQALVSTWQNGLPDTSLASPLHFNHVIAYCPSVGGGIWLDPTEKWCHFGELPWYDQGLPVLMVDANGKAKILTTPRSAASENRGLDAWQVQLDSSGAATVRGISTFSGMLAIEQRNDIGDLTPSDQRRWVESYVAHRCSGATLDSVSIGGLRPVGDSLRVSYQFHTSTFALRGARGLVLHPGSAAASDLPDYFRSPVRETPIRFRFGLSADLTMDIRLPEGWALCGTALSDSVRSPFGGAYWSWRADGAMLNIRTGHHLAGSEIAVNQYRHFQEFLDAMRYGDMREVELERQAVRLEASPRSENSRAQR